MRAFDYFRIARLRGKLRQTENHSRRIREEIAAIESGKSSIADRVLITVVRWCA